jgi:alkylation response protein AidB-like acyl-CoA dehydrogenase
VDFRLSTVDEAFRGEVRCFLAGALPPDFAGFEEESAESKDYWALSRELSRRLASRGWLAPGWPPEYGGVNASAREQWVLAEELGYHAAPFYNRTVSIIGSVLMNFGTPEQKARFLSAIGRGEVEFCVGLTEPEHGSDLAGVQCWAEETAGGGFVLSGQKIYSSNAHHADFCMLLARTDAQASRHRGLSLFIVDMKARGLEVCPLVNSLGIHCFNQIFFDGVAVPWEGLVGGEPGHGWHQIVYSLNHERTVHAAGIARAALYRRTLDDLMVYIGGQEHPAEGLGVRPSALSSGWVGGQRAIPSCGLRGGVVTAEMRGKLAALATEVEVFRLLSWRIALMQVRGLIPEWEAAMTKLFGSRLMGRLASLWVEAQGLWAGGGRPQVGGAGGTHRAHATLLSGGDHRWRHTGSAA